MDSVGVHCSYYRTSCVALVLYQGECEVLARSSCSEVIRDRTMLYANIGHLIQGVICPLSAHDATTAEEVIRERKVLLPADTDAQSGLKRPLGNSGYCCLIQKVGRETHNMGRFPP